MSASDLSITVNDLVDVEYSFAEDSYPHNRDISISHEKVDSRLTVCRMDDSEPSDIKHVDSSPTVSDVDQPSKRTDEKTVVRQYFNKAGEFIVGIDPFSEEAKAKAEERIRRFGQVVRPEDIITNDVLGRLYASLGINGPTDDGDDRIRRGVIHISGTDDLSTQDIFDYFQEFVPTSIEWINDHSCNVIWSEAATAARAMLKLSHEIEEQMNEDDSCPDIPKYCQSNIGDEKMEIDKKMDSDGDDEDGKDSDGRRYKDFSKKGTNKPPNAEEGIKNDITRWSEVRWRMGKPHPKSKMDLLMRFATTDDKKEPRANSKSIYYMKHGNPNYGGFKGLLTRGCKLRVLRQQRNKVQPPTNQEGLHEKESTVDDLNFGRRVGDIELRKKARVAFKRDRWSADEDESNQEIKVRRERHVRDEFDAPRSKVPRMRMYADDEYEEETETDKRKRAGIWLRLGSNERVGHRERDRARVVPFRR